VHKPPKFKGECETCEAEKELGKHIEESSKIFEVIGKAIGQDPTSLDLDTDLSEDLGLNPIEIYHIYEELEKAFDVDFGKREEYEQVATIRAISGFILNR